VQTRSTSQCGRLNLCAVVAVFLGASTACSILTGTLLALPRPLAASNASERTLTFEERVVYQRAIEDVYWRHRIWPRDRGERPDPKPSLDAVMSQAQLEKKVADYLRSSQALEDYWQQPNTAKQLQAEMDRMAKNTKQPEVLRELFEALRNDPFVIAECLARPALAERLLTNWYAYDERIHGERKRRAEAELKANPAVGAMKQLSGKYSEVDLVRSDSSKVEPNNAAERSVRLNNQKWDEAVQGLAAVFNEGTQQLTNGRHGPLGRPSLATRPAVAPYQTLPVGKLTSLQEDRENYYATALIEKTTDRLKLATVSWLKEPLESWLARVENHMRTDISAPSSSYSLLTTSGGGECIEDTWTATSADSAPLHRESHTAVWTGSEMIVWGGFSPSALNTGARYDPATDTWTAISVTNAPVGRAFHTAVWTGNEMIVWGGEDDNASFLNTGGKYNPATNSWIATSTVNAPEGRVGHTAVWSGNEMMVWGGALPPQNPTNTGGRYNPSTDSWIATTTANAPEERYSHTAIWTGSEMIAWAGFDHFTGEVLNTGGRYNPATNTWTATSSVNVPTPRLEHTAVWTGNEMIVWGGSLDTTGGRYNPGNDSWTATNTVNAPSERAFHTAAWTGLEMIIWGGNDENSYLNTGAAYNPATDSWTITTDMNAPSMRAYHTAVWTGSEMIVWGGFDGSNYLETGGRYCAQSGPTPTPSPTATATSTPTATPTASPTPTTTPRVTPRPRPTPHSRPTLP
jgi:N-acetylneuraminic acid mutarotase